MYVFSFFPPFKPSSFLFWLLPSSSLSFLYFLTLSGLVSCVTGNVTVSVFFFPLVITATLSFLLYSLHYSTIAFFSFFPPLMICFTRLKLSPKCLPSCQPYVAPRLCCDKLHQRSNCTVICLHCDGENTAHCVQCSQKVSYTLNVCYSSVHCFPTLKKVRRRLQELIFGEFCTSTLLFFFQNKKFLVCWNV